jgi:hypothetical protein
MEENQAIQFETSRFIYSDDFSKEIEYFSKLHQYDDRKTFKEMWLKWIEEESIKGLINEEMERCTKNGYNGDIMDKMYKSARYYYRKKEMKCFKKEEQNKNDDNDSTSEINYSGLSKEMIKQMDLHIYEHINSNMEKSKNNTLLLSKVRPANAFDDFCKKCIKEIAREILKLKKKITLNPNEISTKFKKAYKNRFYKIRLLLEKK